MSASVQTEFSLDSPPPSENISRLFLGWDRPLLTVAAELLSTLSPAASGPLNLSALAVVVPTRNASRRLRERLAILAAERGTGVLPPLILNPDDLLSVADPPLPTASKTETLAAWIEALMNLDLDNARHLFPLDPVERNFSWALRTARDFMQVQSLLGEAAHNTAYVAKVLASHDIEPERWAELARLEGQVHGLLERSGRQARSAMRRDALENFHLPQECTRLILLGVPDAPPALDPLVKRLSHTTEVQVAIHAPEEFSDSFDLLGRPLEQWSQEPLLIPDDCLHQSSNPTTQASWTHKRISSHAPGSAPLFAAVGVPDAEVIAPLREELTTAGMETFDPAGIPLSGHGLCHLLTTLSHLATTQSMDRLRELLRNPGIAEAAGHFQIPDGSEPFSSAKVIAQFDILHENHLCDTIREAWEVLPHGHRFLDRQVIGRGLSWIQYWLQQLDRSPLAESLPAFLSEVYQYASFTPGEDFEQAVQLFHQTLDELEAAPLPKLSPGDEFQLFRSLLEEQTLSSTRPQNAIDLVGWLELPWEDAPHLIITGFNEGLVPETIQGHPWLPNQARLLLGLRHNAQRQARDAYLLTSLIASRKDRGQVDILFGRVNEQSDPLRPSRLLLSPAPEDLPSRVDLLFQAIPSESDPLPWQMSWQLTPPVPAAFERLSVTSFSGYLACPFRFYLKFGLKMQSPDLDRSELNPRDFGNVVHQVLENFAGTSAAQSTEATEIAAAFDDLLSDFIAKTYGKSLSAPLILQTESIRQRLRWWAHSEAEQRADGWVIDEVEGYLAPKDAPFLIGGMPINGMIDRIESHPKLGLRIIDFKTKKKPTAVDEAHLKKLGRNEDPADYPEWALVQHNGKDHRWINLQVPLYLLALRERYPHRELTSGYVALGMAQNDVRLDLWEDMTPELLDSARRCALGVITAIRAKQFWPPAEKTTYDDFKSILFDDPLAAVNPTNLITPTAGDHA